jgi:hypothetical protein
MRKLVNSEDFLMNSRIKLRIQVSTRNRLQSTQNRYSRSSLMQASKLKKKKRHAKERN